MFLWLPLCHAQQEALCCYEHNVAIALTTKCSLCKRCITICLIAPWCVDTFFAQLVQGLKPFCPSSPSVTQNSDCQPFEAIIHILWAPAAGRLNIHKAKLSVCALQSYNLMLQRTPSPWYKPRRDPGLCRHNFFSKMLFIHSMGAPGQTAPGFRRSCSTV